MVNIIELNLGYTSNEVIRSKRGGVRMARL